MKITSPRLTLIPLNHKDLMLWKENGRAELELSLNLNPNQLTNDDRILNETQDALVNFWIPQTLKNLVKYHWFTNWEIVLSEKNISIGGIGFGGYPENGVTEIGYMIDEKFQQNGFATEAVQTLLNWANTELKKITVKAQTPIDNLASQLVLRKNNFIETSQGIAENHPEIQVIYWEKKI